jgi:hypothetical protein
MSAHDVEAEFAPRGIRHGRALLLDERAALVLVDRAAQLGVAIVAVDQVRREEVHEYLTLRGEIDGQFERTASWDQARQFIRALTGRGLLFEVVLENRAASRLLKPRGFLTVGDTHAALFSAVFVLFVALIAVMLGTLGR